MTEAWPNLFKAAEHLQNCKSDNSEECLDMVDSQCKLINQYGG